MAIEAPKVEDVIKYLDNLTFGTHKLDSFVAKVNLAAFKEIVIDYSQSHAEVYFTSDMKAIKKLDLAWFYKNEQSKKEAA